MTGLSRCEPRRATARMWPLEEMARAGAAILRGPRTSEQVARAFVYARAPQDDGEKFLLAENFTNFGTPNFPSMERRDAIPAFRARHPAYASFVQAGLATISAPRQWPRRACGGPNRNRKSDIEGHMTMSTIYSAPAVPRGIAGASWTRKLVAAVQRWLAAYMTWRMEQQAIAALSM